jgi:hypothetical protein
METCKRLVSVEQASGENSLSGNGNCESGRPDRRGYRVGIPAEAATTSIRAVGVLSGYWLVRSAERGLGVGG